MFRGLPKTAFCVSTRHQGAHFLESAAVRPRQHVLGYHICRGRGASLLGGELLLVVRAFLLVFHFFAFDVGVLG